MNCPYCGAEVADGQAFCPVCGGLITAPPSENGDRVAKPEKQVNKKKRVLLCVLGVIALALAAVIAFTVVRRVQIPDYVAYVESLLPTGDGDYWQDRARLETLHDRHIGFLDRLLMSARERRAADFAARAAEIDEALYAQHLEAKKNAELLVKDKNAALDRMTSLAETPYDTVGDLRQLTADADGARDAFYDEVAVHGEDAEAVFDGENAVWALVIGQDVGDVLADYADDTPFDALSETDRNRIRLLLELYVAEIGVRRNADDTAAMDRLTVLLYAHSAGPYAVGLRREFRSSVGQEEDATDQTAEASSVSESASVPAAENPYEEREYLSFFNEKLVPLLEDQAVIFPGFHGYVCALPPTGASLGEVNWSNLMTFYTGEWTGKDYSDSYPREDDDLYRSYPHLPDADFLTAADLEKAHAIEAYTDLYSGNLWITMKEPDRLQAAADALFGPGRVDVGDMIDPAIGKPRGFVSENGYLLYLSIDGIDGDMLYPDAFFDVRNVEMTAEGAVLTVRALHFVTTPFDGSYEFFGFPYPSHADYDTYQKMRLDEGMLTESETARLRESDFDEIVRATGFDPAKATTLLVTLRAAENGIVLEDLRVADPAELPETQPSTAAPEPSTEPSTEPSSAPVPQNTDAARNAAYRAFIDENVGGSIKTAVLADVTRDNEPELILVSDTDTSDDWHGDLICWVVTYTGGKTVLLEKLEHGKSVLRANVIWYLKEVSPGAYDLFDESHGVSTGGTVVCEYKLYSLTSEKERIVEESGNGAKRYFEDTHEFSDEGYSETVERTIEIRQSAYQLCCFRDQDENGETYGLPIPASLRFPLE